MRKSCLIFIAANVVLGLAFYLYPEFDLRFAGLFFDPGRGFLISDRSALNVIRLTTIVFVNGSLLLLLVNWRRGRTTTRSDYWLTPNRNVIFLLLALGLGPGLLVNGVLKSYWGRARPYDVIEFGGKKVFTPAFVPSHQCPSNCSFVSGDAAVGYYFLAFVFVSRKWRRQFGVLGVFFGTAVGLVRIAQGAHFLSDVIFAGTLTFLVAWFLSFLLKVRIRTDGTLRHRASETAVPSSLR